MNNPHSNDLFIDPSDEVKIVLLFAVMRLTPEDGEKVLMLTTFNAAQFPKEVKLSKIPKDYH